MSKPALYATGTTLAALLPGDRVRIIAECVGWLPRILIGGEATVLRTNGAGITIRPDRAVAMLGERYVPRAQVGGCLERIHD